MHIEVNTLHESTRLVTYIHSEAHGHTLHINTYIVVYISAHIVQLNVTYFTYFYLF